MNDLKMHFDNLDAKKAAIVGVILLVVYYFLFFNDGSQIDAQTAANEAEIQKYSMTLDKVQKALEDEKRFNREISEITSHMNTFLEYFPINLDKNQLMKILSKKAEDHGVILNNLKPIDQAPEFPNYPEFVFSFSVEGTFHQVMSFVAGLTQLKRVVDFRNVNFKVAKRDDIPRVELETLFIVYGNKEVMAGGASGG